MVLAAVVVLAAVLRFARLGDIPGNITADEADNLRVIFRIQESGEPGFFGFDWKPAPAFSMYLFDAFMVVFGDTPFGLRSASAVLGSAALVPFFAIARRTVSFPAALAATVLLGTNRWYLHFSRSGWENVHVAAFALLATWALLVGLERAQLRWFSLAGVAATLGLYGYFAGRLILPALVLYAPIAWWAVQRRRRRVLHGNSGPRPTTTYGLHGRRRARRALIGVALLVLVAVGLALPQLIEVRERWDYFNQRSSNVSVLNQPRPFQGEDDALGIVLGQLRRNLSGYVLLDGELFNNGRYGAPQTPPYDRFTMTLTVIGFVLAVRRWRIATLWAALLAVPFVGTQVFTAPTPDLARATVFAPFPYLFAALTIDAGFRLVGRRHRAAAYAVLVAAVAIVATTHVVHYFRWINTEGALTARRPAVELEDYRVWERAVRCDFRGRGPGPRSQPWDERRDVEVAVGPVLPADDPRYCDVD